MATKRGTRGDFGCKVPPGGKRRGCGGDNEVFELRKEIKRAVKDEVSDMDKRHAKDFKAHKKEVAKRIAAVSSPGVPAESTSRPREAVSAAAKGEAPSMAGAPLRARIAKALGWTEAGVNSFSLSMLREMVRDKSPQLSDEIGRSLSTGSHVVGEYRPRRKLR